MSPPQFFNINLKVKELVHFFEDETKLKIPSEITPLLKKICNWFSELYKITSYLNVRKQTE